METKESIRIEVLAEILESVGLTATEDQLKNISEDFALHLEMENEMDSYAHVGTVRRICSDCKIKESEIEKMKEREEVFVNSVKIRRNAQEVWIEGSSVMYR